MDQTQPLTRERGGIAVRDYTQGGRSSRLRLRRSQNSGWGAINYDALGRFLGFFSLGLGLFQLIRPRALQKLVGVRKGDYSTLIRAAGARELTHGTAIFLQSRPHTAVWSRVAGDVFDLGTLGLAFKTRKPQVDRLITATALVAGITALDVLTAIRLGKMRKTDGRYSVLKREDQSSRTKDGAFHVARSVTINRTPEMLYRFWRDFANLPQIMYHLEEVHVLDNKRSHWVAKAPAGLSVEWDAEITEDRLNERIAWRSTADADVPNDGVVSFEPHPSGQGTLVRVEIDYRPPAGALGRAVAVLFGEEPNQQVAADLRRFKQLMETGEVILSEGAPAGFGQKMQRPAQPLSQGELRKLPQETPAQTRREIEMRENQEEIR